MCSKERRGRPMIQETNEGLVRIADVDGFVMPMSSSTSTPAVEDKKRRRHDDGDNSSTCILFPNIPCPQGIAYPSKEQHQFRFEAATKKDQRPRDLTSLIRLQPFYPIVRHVSGCGGKYLGNGFFKKRHYKTCPHKVKGHDKVYDTCEIIDALKRRSSSETAGRSSGNEKRDESGSASAASAPKSCFNIDAIDGAEWNKLRDSIARILGIDANMIDGKDGGVLSSRYLADVTKRLDKDRPYRNRIIVTNAVTGAEGKYTGKLSENDKARGKVSQQRSSKTTREDTLFREGFHSESSQRDFGLLREGEDRKGNKKYFKRFRQKKKGFRIIESCLGKFFNSKSICMYDDLVFLAKEIFAAIVDDFDKLPTDKRFDALIGACMLSAFKWWQKRTRKRRESASNIPVHTCEGFWQISKSTSFRNAVASTKRPRPEMPPGCSHARGPRHAREPRRYMDNWELLGRTRPTYEDQELRLLQKESIKLDGTKIEREFEITYYALVPKDQRSTSSVDVIVCRDENKISKRAWENVIRFKHWRLYSRKSRADHVEVHSERQVQETQERERERESDIMHFEVEGLHFKLEDFDSF